MFVQNTQKLQIHFASSFLTFIPFIWFSCLITIAKIFNIMLSKGVGFLNYNNQQGYTGTIKQGSVLSPYFLKEIIKDSVISSFKYLMEFSEAIWPWVFFVVDFGFFGFVLFIVCFVYWLVDFNKNIYYLLMSASSTAGYYIKLKQYSFPSQEFLQNQDF